jgi:hypothetical protein
MRLQRFFIVKERKLDSIWKKDWKEDLKLLVRSS